jgi:sugar phosphate isomerase/epimerase
MIRCLAKMGPRIVASVQSSNPLALQPRHTTLPPECRNRRVTLQASFIAAILITTLVLECAAKPALDVFSRENLVAWCIIPYDSMHRTPAERARMLKRLGIERLAIDWRAKDIPNFDAEIAALRKNHIAIQAFWVRGDMYPERKMAASADGNLDVVIATLKRNKVRTEIWCPFDANEEFMSLSEPERLTRATEAVRYVARRAKEVNSSVAIYAHGGWMGEPENELKVLQLTGMDNVGIVYDYEHGRPQMDRFPEFFPKLVPHLWAVILNGMQQGGPDFITIGDGDRDLGMLKVIRDSGYRGPIGIMNHDENRDAEVGLRLNMEGLKKMLRQMDDQAALQSY